jgi:hypothetical protein
MLEGLVDGDAPETAFQSFFEGHPEFLQALGPYRRIHPHVILEEDTGSHLIPDFFLEALDGGLADICDLKRATQVLVKERDRRPRFRDQVMAGARQLAEYRNFFEDRANRSAFARKYPHLRAFRPRVILIVGRSEHFADDIERATLESELPGWLSLKTYDDVIKAARCYRGMWGAA